MTEARTDTTGLTLLGQPAALPVSPEAAILERVPNPHPGTRYLVRFAAPEFTSLCPLTGQPDFAHLVIDYVPRDWLVESKSLKLFLGAFRNHGAFHEACTVAIGKRLEALAVVVVSTALLDDLLRAESHRVYPRSPDCAASLPAHWLAWPQKEWLRLLRRQ